MTKRGAIIQKRLKRFSADVPIDDRHERDELHARLRQRYNKLPQLLLSIRTCGHGLTEHSAQTHPATYRV